MRTDYRFLERWPALAQEFGPEYWSPFCRRSDQRPGDRQFSRDRGARMPVAMQAYPHHYDVHAAAETEGSVLIRSQGFPTLTTAPPPQFGGPSDQWSPETLLVAAAADC